MWQDEKWFSFLCHFDGHFWCKLFFICLFLDNESSLHIETNHRFPFQDSNCFKQNDDVKVASLTRSATESENLPPYVNNNNVHDPVLQQNIVLEAQGYDSMFDSGLEDYEHAIFGS